MRFLFIITMLILTSCNVAETEYEFPDASYYMVNDRTSGTTQVYIISSSKKIEDFVIKTDLIDPYPVPRQGFIGSLYIQNGKVVKVRTEQIGYREFEYIDRRVTSITILENFGSIVYVDSAWGKTMMIAGHLNYRLNVGQSYEVIIDRSVSIPSIEALI